MEKQQLSFEASISPWTLFFRNSVHEAGFREFIYEKNYNNPILRFIAYFGISTNLVVQVVFLVNGLMSPSVRGPSLTTNIWITVALVSAFILELGLKFLGRFKLIHGIFICAILPIKSFAISFSANKAPIMDIP